MGDLFDQFWIVFYDVNNDPIASIAVTLNQAGVTRLNNCVAYQLPLDVWLNNIVTIPGVKHWSVLGRWDCFADLYRYSSDALTLTVT